MVLFFDFDRLDYSYKNGLSAVTMFSRAIQVYI